MEKGYDFNFEHNRMVTNYIIFLYLHFPAYSAAVTIMKSVKIIVSCFVFLLVLYCVCNLSILLKQLWSETRQAAGTYTNLYREIIFTFVLKIDAGKIAFLYWLQSVHRAITITIHSTSCALLFIGCAWLHTRAHS